MSLHIPEPGLIDSVGLGGRSVAEIAETPGQHETLICKSAFGHVLGQSLCLHIRTECGKEVVIQKPLTGSASAPRLRSRPTSLPGCGGSDNPAAAPKVVVPIAIARTPIEDPNESAGDSSLW